MLQVRAQLFAWLFATMWILSSLGWASGSRVGNGNGKPGVQIEIDSNFEAKSEIPFHNVKRFSDGIRIEGPAKMVLKFGRGVPSISGLQKINIRNFKTERPRLAELSKAEMTKFFVQNNWTQYKLENPCLQAWTFEKDGIITAIVTSAVGEGYIASADSTQDAKHALEKILSTTKLKKDCALK